MLFAKSCPMDNNIKLPPGNSFDGCHPHAGILDILCLGECHLSASVSLEDGHNPGKIPTSLDDRHIQQHKGCRKGGDHGHLHVTAYDGHTHATALCCKECTETTCTETDVS